MGVLKAKGAKAVAKAVEAKVKAAKAQARGGWLLRTGRQQVCVLDTASERSVTSQSVVITQPEQPVILRLVKAMASCRPSVQRGHRVPPSRSVSTVSDVSTNTVMARSNLSLNMANDPCRVTWPTLPLPRFRLWRLCLVRYCLEEMVPLMHNSRHFLRKLALRISGLISLQLR